MKKYAKPTQKEFVEFYKHHTGRETAHHFEIAYSTVSKYAREYAIPRRSFRHKEVLAELTQRQLEIFNGSMLGDGCLEEVETEKSNSRFIEKHGIQQVGYARWKFDELKPFSSSFTISKEIYDYCKFGTINHPCFTILEKIWYDENRKKRVPIELKITPLTLAIWYFDDGYNNKNARNITIYTNGFKHDEVELLASKIKILGIHNCSVIKSSQKNGCRPIVYIGRSSYSDFLDIVNNYVPSQCLAYKVETYGKV